MTGPETPAARVVALFATDAGAWLASARIAANGGPEVEVERRGRGFAVVAVWDDTATDARAILRDLFPSTSGEVMS